MRRRSPAKMRTWILSFLLVANCSATTYYIDFASGSDSNNGTSKTTPWKHQPYMQGRMGGYTHAAGDQFIFKGGVTWDRTCYPVTISSGGNSGKNDYYGVDTSWYVGGSWSRPIFNGSYADSSGKTNFFFVGTTNYITFDNLEMTQLMGDSDFVAMISGGYDVDNIVIQNCYFHGWRCNVSTDSQHGAVAFNQGTSTITSVVMQNCVVENSENRGTGTQNGQGARQVQTIRGCIFHDLSSGVDFTADYNGNTMYNISYPSGNVGFDQVTFHFNGVYLDAGGTSSGVSYIRNSIFHDISGGANTIYLNPHQQTQIAYNNLIYGVQSGQLPIEIDTYNYGSGNGGTVYCFNNTIVASNDNDAAIHQVALGPSRPVLDLLVAINNQIIYPTGGRLTDAIQGVTVTTLTASNNILQTAVLANSQGYTLANLYQPTAGGWTIHAGFPESGLFTTDMLGDARPQGYSWDVGAYEFVNSAVPLSTGKFKYRDSNLH